ncbi:dual specificity protein phosphatase family protein [Planococcus sp. ISL-110]|uniref:protein-tyrosine phosphatase family protein n=1 Tax=Planococcus sp. ISL-110 TaxID=2819167 RepID=UPI001BE6D721|nr:dual specificity protein phosphatase family protein [Planococcus sp. ISL-110]MBT2570730.1 dual specificity protein phosphatase family protein [Planococcus sp. ISL-110]
MSKEYQELVKDRIFIGGAADAKGAVEDEKIDVVIDLRAEAAEGDYDYVRVHSPIVDDSDEQQDESIKKAIDQVVDAYQDGKKVYFHCAGGSNRTGTVAIGTLLALGKADTVQEAEAQATAVRPIIMVKPQLKESLKRIFYKD